MSDERYQQRQQRVKEKVDARIADAQEERGILMVFTGNGKGKTTAAFGTVTRRLSCRLATRRANAARSGAGFSGAG